MVYCQTDTLEKHVEMMIVNEYHNYQRIDDIPILNQISGLLEIWQSDWYASQNKTARWNLFAQNTSYDDILSIFNRIAFNLTTYYPPDYVEFKATAVYMMNTLYDIVYIRRRGKNAIIHTMTLIIDVDKKYKANRPKLLEEIAKTLDDYLDRDTLSIVLVYQL